MNRTLLVIFVLSFFAFAAAPADQLLESGSFEIPRVAGRTPLAKGGNPMLVGRKTDWSLFLHPRPTPENGAAIAGITDEVAHSGRQSLFIEFDKFRAIVSGPLLVTDLISIQPGKPYHFSIWGRVDKKNPLTIDQRIPYLKLNIEWFAADKETVVGDPFFRAQPLPDSRNRPAQRPPMFSSTKWGEYYMDLDSPEDAAFVKVTWKWESTTEAGTTTGVMYFDDATISGEPGPKPPEPKDEPEENSELKMLEKEAAGAKPSAPAATDAAPKK